MYSPLQYDCSMGGPHLNRRCSFTDTNDYFQTPYFITTNYIKTSEKTHFITKKCESPSICLMCVRSKSLPMLASIIFQLSCIIVHCKVWKIKKSRRHVRHQHVIGTHLDCCS